MGGGGHPTNRGLGRVIEGGGEKQDGDEGSSAIGNEA